MGQKTRLYLKQPMAKGQDIILEPAQAHYLFSVMRLSGGDEILVFNGVDGEFSARLEALGKRAGYVRLEKQTRPLMVPSDLWLLFAPIKKERTDFIVEKAAELGVGRILPVCTAYSNTKRINATRLRAHIIEAAEQCGATALPELSDLQPLDAALGTLEPARRLIFCDETLSEEGAEKSCNIPVGPAAIIIGPEAGFSPKEREKLRAYPNLTSMGLGKYILRADTAAIVAIALCQHAQSL